MRINNVSYVTMLIDNLNGVKNYTKHSGIEIATLKADLQSLVDRYKALSSDKQAAALLVVSGSDYLSSTQTRTALANALKTQEDASAAEVTAALAAVNNATADSNYAAMKTAIETNA